MQERRLRPPGVIERHELILNHWMTDLETIA